MTDLARKVSRILGELRSTELEFRRAVLDARAAGITARIMHNGAEIDLKDIYVEIERGGAK